MHKLMLSAIISVAVILMSCSTTAMCEPETGDAPAAQAYLDAATKAMYEDQDYAEALKLAETALKIDPVNVQALDIIGGVYSMTGRPSDASKTYLRLYEISGGSECNWLDNASYFAVTAGDYKDATAFLEAYLTRHPEDRCALYSLAGSYNSEGRFSNALDICNKLIGLDPENYRYHTQKAEALEGLGRPEEALDSYKTAAKLSGYVYSEMSGAIYNLVSLGRYDEAIELLDATIKEHPDVSGPYKQKGEILISLGKTEEAESVMREGLDKAPDYDLVFKLAGIAVLQSDYDKALRYLDTDDIEDLNTGPEYSLLTDLLSVLILAHTGNTNDALAMLDRLSASPEMADTTDAAMIETVKSACRMLIYYSSGNYLQAELMLDRLSEDESLKEAGVQELIDFLRVYVLAGLEEYDEAMAILDDTVDGQEEFDYLKAFLLLQRGGKGDAEKARTMLEANLPLEDNPGLNMDYAWKFALLGRKKEMLEQLDGLIKDEPLSKLLILHMPEFRPYLDDPDFIEVVGR